MAPNTTLTSALIVLALACFTSAPTEPESLHDETKSLSGVITKTVTFLCSARLGVPSSMVSPRNSLQIYLDNNYHGEEMVVASAFSYGETKVGEMFIQRAPQATVEGNITVGWLKVIIPDLTDETLGNYKCVLNQVQSSGHVKYNRSLPVGRESSGTMDLHTMGFTATVSNKVTVQCGIESGCYCNNSFSIQFLENQEGEKLNKNCEETASWQCKNDLKKPPAQVKCHLSVMCGKVEAQFNCTTKEGSLTSLYEFICDPAVLSSQMNASSNNSTKSETSLAPDRATHVGEQSCERYDLLWIIPLCVLVGAFLKPLACIICKYCNPFFACIFYFVLMQFFDSSSPNTNKSISENDDLKSIQIDSNTTKEEMERLVKPPEGDEGPSEKENGASAVASVILKPKDRDIGRKSIQAVQDEEGDIDTN